MDINPDCKQFEKEGVRIVIGDQSNPAFWDQFILDFPEEPDIFIDDGGHTMAQQILTLKKMFWRVRDGGIYLCEDLHTSYWREYEGGYLKDGSMIEMVKPLIDTINAWHSKDEGSQVQSDNDMRYFLGIQLTSIPLPRATLLGGWSDAQYPRVSLRPGDNNTPPYGY